MVLKYGPPAQTDQIENVQRRAAQIKLDYGQTLNITD